MAGKCVGWQPNAYAAEALQLRVKKDWGFLSRHPRHASHPDTSLSLLLVFSAQGKFSFRIRHDFCKLPDSVLIRNGLTEFNQRRLLCSPSKFGAGKWALKHHSKLLRGALASSFPFSALPCPPHPFPSPWSSLLVPALCVLIVTQHFLVFVIGFSWDTRGLAGNLFRSTVHVGIFFCPDSRKLCRLALYFSRRFPMLQLFSLNMPGASSLIHSETELY